MKNPPQRAALAALSLVLALVILPLKGPFNWYDEGFTALNATRVLTGEIPYRDFWTFYPPAQFYALALAFKLFGTNLLIARLYDVCIRLTILLGVFLLGRRITSAPTALLATVLAGLTLGAAGFYTWAVFPCLALGVLSLVVILTYLATSKPMWLVVSGALVGLAVLFRIDFGLYAAITACATLLLSARSGVRTDGRRMVSPMARIPPLFVFAGAALAVAFPVYALLAAKVGLAVLWDQLIGFPLSTHDLVRARPVPPWLPNSLVTLPAWLKFHTPLVTSAVALMTLAGPGKPDTTKEAIRRAGVLAAALFSALLFIQAVRRFDGLHLVPTQCVGFVVAGVIAERARNISLSRLQRVGCFLLVFLYVVPPVTAAMWSLARTTVKYPVSGCYSRIPRASCIAMEPEQELAVAYVVDSTRAGEPIFVGNQRHDSIFVNELGFYFLADRPPPTPYAELFPEVATTLSVQKQIVDDLTRHGVKCVVTVAVPTPAELGETVLPAGAVYLDEYIANHFAVVARFGKYEIRRHGVGAARRE